MENIWQHISVQDCISHASSYKDGLFTALKTNQGEQYVDYHKILPPKLGGGIVQTIVCCKRYIMCL